MLIAGIALVFFAISIGYGATSGIDLSSDPLASAGFPPVSSCTTINSPGTYTLTQNILNSNATICINITSSNVIFDGQGFTIDGVDTSNTYGVHIFNSSITLTNVTIKNLVVTDWYHGIYYQNAQNGSITNNTVNSNFNSISVVSSSNNILANNNANSNVNIGIFLWTSSSSNTLTSNTVSSNFAGISLVTSSNSNTLNSNTVNSNFYGIQIASSSNNILTNNNANSNYYGVYLQYSNNNTIFNNFFNNTVNARDNVNAIDTGFNFWNTTKTAGTNIVDGPYLGGNFWHDYNGTDIDSDSLGNTNLPYNSSGNILNGGDYLPLVKLSVCGDVNGNGVVTLADVVYFQQYLYSGGPPPVNFPDGDINADGVIDTFDVSLLIPYLFMGGNLTCSPKGTVNASTTIILDAPSEFQGNFTFPIRGVFNNPAAVYQTEISYDSSQFAPVSSYPASDLESPVSSPGKAVYGRMYYPGPLFNGSVNLTVAIFRNLTANYNLSSIRIVKAEVADSEGRKFTNVTVVNPVLEQEFDFTWSVAASTAAGAHSSGPDCLRSGVGSVSDMDYDKFIANLTQECYSPDSAIAGIINMSITFGGNTYHGNPKSDIFITDRNADIYAWIVTEPEWELHASRKMAEALDHPFDYNISADGTESPPQFFNYTITAVGEEVYTDRSTQRVECNLEKPGTLIKKCTEEAFCGGGPSSPYIFTGEPARIHEDTKGDWDINEQVFNQNAFALNIKHCNRGEWFKGWVNLIYEIPTEGNITREWSKEQRGGVYSVVNGEPNKFIDTYVKGFGTGDPRTIPGSVLLKEYKLKSSNLTVELSINYSDGKLYAITFYKEPWTNKKAGSNTTNKSEGIKNITSHNVKAPNNDTRYSVAISSKCYNCPGTAIYRDINGDGVVEFGQPIAWMDGFNGTDGGPVGYYMFAAIDAPLPIGIIDNITNTTHVINVSIFGDDINFTGHGEPVENITTWWWRSHKEGRIGSLSSFVINFLSPANPHHIFFSVYSNAGLWSPESPRSTAQVIVNTPPTAYINYIKGFTDETGQIVALLGEPVEFNGYGFDTDGFIEEQKWIIAGNEYAGGLVTEKFTGGITPRTERVTFLVKDNVGTWSRNVSREILVIRHPVLLVPGYLRGEKSMRKLKESLEDDGYDVSIADLRKPVSIDVGLSYPLKSDTFKDLALAYKIFYSFRELYLDLKEMKSFVGSNDPDFLKAYEKFRESLNDAREALDLLEFKAGQIPLKGKIDELNEKLDEIDAKVKEAIAAKNDVTQLAAIFEEIFNGILKEPDFFDNLWKDLIKSFEFKIKELIPAEVMITKISVPLPMPEKAKDVIIGLVESGVIKIPGQLTVYEDKFTKKIKRGDKEIIATLGFKLLVKNIKPILENHKDLKLTGDLYVSDISVDIDPPDLPFTLYPDEIRFDQIPIGGEGGIIQGTIDVRVVLTENAEEGLVITLEGQTIYAKK